MNRHIPVRCKYLILWTLGICIISGTAFAAEKIRARAWAHSEFARIVFDWPTKVQFTAKIVGNKLTIRFSKKFSTDLRPVAEKLQHYISSISIGDDGKSIVAKLKKSFQMRSFENEGAIVVDLAERPRGGSFGAAIAPRPIVAKPKPVATKAVAKAAARKAPPRLNVRTGEHRGYIRLVFDWTKKVKYQAGHKGGKVDIQFSRRASIDVAKLRKSISEQVGVIETDNKGRGLHIRLHLKKNGRIRHFRDGTLVVVDIYSVAANVAKNAKNISKSQASRRPVPLTKRASRRKARARAKQRARNRSITFGPKGALVTVKVARQSKEKVNLHFNWRNAVAAAFFRRHGNIWIYFDKASRIDLGGLKVLGDGIIDDAQQYPIAKGSLVRLSVDEGYAATVSKDGVRWVLDIGPRPLRKLAHPISVTVEFDGPVGPRIVASLPEPEPAILLRDPEVGDVIGIVPVKSAGYGVEKSRRFIDFTLFSSALGVAYLPMSEGLQVSSQKSGVIISRPLGLMISHSEDMALVRAHVRVDRGQVLWNIKSWRRGSSDKFEEMRNRLIDRVINARASRRNAARINLAKFYLAHGAAADAMGIVAVVVRQKPNRAQRLTLRSLRGAGSYLLHHFGESQTLFDDPNLKAEEGAMPWLAALSAAKGNWSDANEKFSISDSVIELYPNWLRRKFMLLAAEAALVSGQTESAQSYLQALTPLAPPPEQLAAINYLRGYLLKQTGKLDEAISLWSALKNSKNRLVRAKALFAITEADLEKKLIDRPGAIKRLEKLSFAWRGDVFEYDLLRRLGELYIAEHRYRMGFSRLRRAASYFKKVGGAESVTQLMNSHFKQLYLGGVADKLPPVTALALFEEFRELAPAGSEGDEMVQKLADRLAKVDLLDEAAKLLDHQVKFRLDGAQKARIGMRTSIIRLLDNKPDMALKALADSEVSDMPMKLERQRRYLKANILGRLGKISESMSLLDGDLSDEADKIRLAVVWRSSKWKKASIVIQRILSKRELTSDDAEGARLVVQWVIAKAMLGDDNGLEDLRTRFGQVMAKSKQAKTFKVLVGNSLDGISDYSALVKAAGDIDRLQAFMGEYRNVVREEGQSAIN